MFGIGMPEMLLILAVALIVFGPKKLPELGKSLGRALGEFKRATTDIKESFEVDTGLKDVRDKIDEMGKDLKRSLNEAPPGESTPAAPTSTADPLAKVQEAFAQMNTAAPAEESPAPADDKANDQPPQGKSTT